MTKSELRNPEAIAHGGETLRVDGKMSGTGKIGMVSGLARLAIRAHTLLGLAVALAFVALPLLASLLLRKLSKRAIKRRAQRSPPRAGRR